jgi:Tol biopolymer transport system component
MKTISIPFTLLSLFLWSGILLAQTAPTTRDGSIVYTTLQPYNLDIYLRDKPGSPLRRITTHQANDYNATFSPDGRWLVFCSERNGNPDLFALDLYTRGEPLQLTRSPTMEDAPSFSPDGSKILFVSDRHGTADIFVMPFNPKDRNGDEKAINLTSHPGGDFNPAFSPDGRRIAFSSDRHFPPSTPEYWRKKGEGSETYVMDVDGRNVSRLTNAIGWDGSPMWADDGSSIYFYSQRDSSTRIWAMSTDGSNQRPVTSKETGNALSPATAPNGRIAFSSDGKIFTIAPNGDALREEVTEGGLSAPAFDLKSGMMAGHADAPVENRVLRADKRPFAGSGTESTVRLRDRTVRISGIYPTFPSFNPTGKEIVAAHSQPGDRGRTWLVVSNADGTNLRTIGETEGQIISTTWSPDGEWIAFAEGLPFAQERTRVDIWRVRPDGSDRQKLTDSNSNAMFPDFSGDSRQIVFRGGQTGSKNIYLMEADGSNVRRLTHGTHIDTMPALSPDGAWVAFASDQWALSGTADFDLFFLQLRPDGLPGASARAWLPGMDQIIGTTGPEVHPKFSPDGRWIVYTSAQGGLNDESPLFDAGPQPYGEIWALPFPSGAPIRLTHNKWEDGLPDWADIK